MKVFISSTYEDLKEYRQSAIDVMNHFRCLPLAMEFFDSQSKDAETVCEKEIRDCDIFIGLYAHRYGFIPKGKQKSITQQEYELAIGCGKDCLCFIVDEKFPWIPAFIEIDKQKELKAFLEIVRQQKVLSFFTTPQDFETKLTASLGKYLVEKNAGSGCKERIMGKESYIPRAPYPYMAHPYALPEHFTGRRAEMDELSDWFFKEKQPMLVLEAIGGMGKSALSWAWLQKEIIEKAEKVDGVFWWSFYHKPFESFLMHLYCYVTGKEITPEKQIDMEELAAALNHRGFLLVLDGLERALRGYAGMEAMFIQEKRFAGDTHAENEWDKRQREPMDPKAGRFLQVLCAGNTKTLITTRLMPVSLEEIAGVKHVFLTGLSAEDTVSFFRNEGIKGTRAEMEQAGGVYGFHPLRLKLLASSIKRSRAKDIKEAFSMNIIDQKEPHKVLDKSFHLLSEEERRVVTRLAVFRGVFTFDAAKALAMEVEENRLWGVMQELRNLGFLFYDKSQERFDFHPILRSFLYKQLASSGRTEVHNLAARYFRALPESQKVVSLEDLTPLIELFHHMAKAGKYDEAFNLFYGRMYKPCFYRFSAYHLIIELLMEILPGGEIDGRMSLLKEAAYQACTLNYLANSYSLSGQPTNAVPLYLLNNKLQEKDDNKKNLAIGLGNAAGDQMSIGQLSTASGHLRKNIAFDREIKDEFYETYGHLELGRLLAFQGRATTYGVSLNPSLDGSANAEEEFAKSTAYFEKTNNYQGLSVTSAYRSLSALMQVRLAAAQQGMENLVLKHSREALHQARQALTFSEETIKTQYPVPRDFVQAYWLLGEVLICYGMNRSAGAKNIDPLEFEILFYDEYFQWVVETEIVTTVKPLTAAGHCLHEAICRCRKANMVDIEPDILLALVRFDVAQNKPPDETLLKEAFEIALRSGYRRVLADLHLFCGQVLLQFKDMKSLLGLTAVEHLQKTKEYALDVSDISHLYSPVKTTADDFYKGIPEYDMLKRGLTDEERIQNGYWVAYQIAETLLKESHSNATNTSVATNTDN